MFFIVREKTKICTTNLLSVCTFWFIYGGNKVRINFSANFPVLVFPVGFRCENRYSISSSRDIIQP